MLAVGLPFIRLKKFLFFFPSSLKNVYYGGIKFCQVLFLHLLRYDATSFAICDKLLNWFLNVEATSQYWNVSMSLIC